MSASRLNLNLCCKPPHLGLTDNPLWPCGKLQTMSIHY